MTKQPEPHSLGEYLRQQRERAGLSQRRLAGMTAIHHSYLARLENGELLNPQAEYLQRIANVLGVDVADFFAFLGVRPEVPEMRAYFRRKLGVNADEADVLAQLIEDYQAKQKKGEKE
jgi:transcriptional regulator with XRE-family HTH domain